MKTDEFIREINISSMYKLILMGKNLTFLLENPNIINNFIPETKNSIDNIIEDMGFHLEKGDNSSIENTLSPISETMNDFYNLINTLTLRVSESTERKREIYPDGIRNCLLPIFNEELFNFFKSYSQTLTQGINYLKILENKLSLQEAASDFVIAEKEMNSNPINEQKERPPTLEQLYEKHPDMRKVPENLVQNISKLREILIFHRYVSNFMIPRY